MPEALRIPVLFCTDGIFPHSVGGMQRHSRLLVEALAQTGEVDLLVLHPHPGTEVFAGLEGVREIALAPLPGRKHYFLELYDYSKKVLEIARQHPDHLIYSQGLSVWAGLSELADRLVVNPHGLEPYQALGWKDRLKTWPYRMVFNRIFRKARHTISLGGRLTDILREQVRRPEQVVVLPNATNPLPLPPEQLHKSLREPVQFLFAGRFAYNKGIDVLLQATQHLNQAGFAERFHLLLAGKGPLFEEMSSRFALPNVTFGGFVPDEDLAQAYLDAHFFVLPTLFEGMPTVVLEAMARATPILVTDVGATRELVGPENGRILRKKEVDDLAQAMREAIEMDAETYESWSRNSLQKFQDRFTWSAVARDHLVLFKSF